MSKLHKYQRRVIDWMKMRPYGYLAIDMGLGKTRCVLEYAQEAQVQLLVVAPLQVALTTWPNEIQKWAPSLTYKVFHGVYKKMYLDMDLDICIINYEGLQWLMDNGSPIFKEKRVLILDEATAVKNRSSKRAAILRKIRKYFSKCFLLSATPCPQGLWDLWSQWRIMDYGRALNQNWSAFQNSCLDTNPWTHAIQLKKGAKKLIVERTKDDIIRLRAQDYLEMPELITNDIMLDLPQKLRATYKTLEQDMVWALNEETTITAANAAICGNKLRQFLQGAIYGDTGEVVANVHTLKVEALRQIIDELNGEPTLIPIAFKFELSLLQGSLDTSLSITGDTPTNERTNLLEMWNQRKLPYLFIHPRAISHGVNLQAGGRYITWLGLTWSLESYQQVNGRLWRQGQDKPVIVNRILFRKTKDEAVAKCLAHKDASQSEVLEAIRASQL